MTVAEAPLSHADAARWHMATPRNPMVITALLLTDERLPLEALEEVVRRKLLPLPRFQQRVVEPPGGGRPRWQAEEPFLLSAHLRRIAAEGDLPRLVGERMSAPLPADRSPWIFELADLPAGGSALIARVHHGIADGQALVTVLRALSDRPPPVTPPPAASPPWWGSLAGLGRLLVDPDEPPTPLRGVLSGEKRVAWSGPVALEAVKERARARDHHLIDLLLAAVAGALRRYLAGQGVASVDVRGLMPVALPAAGRLGNHYASVSVRLPVTEADPIRRMALVAAEVRRGRRGSQLASTLVGWAGMVAPGVERRAVDWRARKASLVVSSLRGPDRKVHLAGVPVGTIIVWAPAPASVALSLALFGYGGELRLGVAADAGVIADPAALVTAFEDELVA